MLRGTREAGGTVHKLYSSRHPSAEWCEVFNHLALESVCAYLHAGLPKSWGEVSHVVWLKMVHRLAAVAGRILWRWVREEANLASYQSGGLQSLGTLPRETQSWNGAVEGK